MKIQNKPISTKSTASGEATQKRSIEELQRLLRENPNDPELLEAMAGLAMMNGEAAGSRTLYLKAIPIFLQTGRPDRAAISYLNILRNFPDTVFPPRDQLVLASTLESQEKYSDAVQAFTLIYEKYPDSQEAQTALLRAAQIHQRNLKAAPVAERLLSTLVSEYPDSPWNGIAQDRLREVKRQIEFD